MRHPPLRCALLATALLTLLLGVPVTAAPVPAPRPGTTQWLVHGDQHTLEAAISADGRTVAFTSFAGNLVAGDTNASDDVFVLDRASGAIQRVSVASDGTQGDKLSGRVALSADGSTVAFDSYSTNITPGDTNGAVDVFVHDIAAGTTVRVSDTATGAQGTIDATYPTLSRDGRLVAFHTGAALLAMDDNNAVDVYLRDLQTGALELVSVAAGGVAADGASIRPALSGDGRFVVFNSYASDVTDPSRADTNQVLDTFVRDRATGRTERVSVYGDTGEANDQAALSDRPSVSDDGRYVAFVSLASNLVPADANSLQKPGLGGTSFDVFVRDRQRRRTERVSVANDGREGLGYSSGSPALSPDGRYVAFLSTATDLVDGDDAGGIDVVLHDRATGATERVSVNDAGVEAGGAAMPPSMSADGRFVTFPTSAKLVAGDSGTQTDLYLRDRGPVLGVQSATVDGDRATGAVTTSGTVISQATDAAHDATGDLGAVGADLVGASVAVRPHTRDVLVRVQVSTMPALRAPSTGPGTSRFVPGATVTPDVLLRFRTGGLASEIRMTRAGEQGQPVFALFDCHTVCTQTATMRGGWGTAGDEVRVHIPLALLRSDLSELELRTGPVDTRFLDRLSLPDASLALPTVAVGAPGELRSAVLDGSRFSVAVPATGPVVAATCFAATCTEQRLR